MSTLVYPWLTLAASIVAEVVGTVALRYADGLTRLLPTALALTCYAGGIWLMALSVRQLEMGLTYAVWAGAGTALTALVGIVWFAESVAALRLVGLCLIVAGVIVLNWQSS